jgi:pimeloyl-ACP methyl ester carboxylesterase
VSFSVVVDRISGLSLQCQKSDVSAHDAGADQEIVMPYVTARDSTRLYYEEAGTGSPILFLHEFAADYASWEPQLRYFSRRHRCIAYSARGYTPSETPAAEAFTYEHFRDDALAVLDHLMEALARHDAQGSAHTQRGFQGGRPSLYAFEDPIRRLTLPVLIVVGDEDDACIEPSLFLKQNIPASGLAMFPKTGHVLNLEEPALFNETLARFLALAEADRWPPRDPASRRA